MVDDPRYSGNPSFGARDTIMPRSFLLVLFVLITGFLNAQFYNWGWGPPISVNQNGSTITCTVWDPELNTTRTNSYTSVAQWIHEDGVVATVSGGGVVRGIVYDIDLGAYVDDSFSFTSSTTITNSAGVIAWVTGSGTVGAAIYNPATHQWVDDQFSFSSGTTIQNRDGVVSWVTGSGTVGAAVYDPGVGQWRDDQFSFSSGTTALNKDGVIAWSTGSGTVGAAVYDPSVGQWMDDQFSFSSNTAIVLEDGVIAWRTGSGTIGAAAYKWGTNAWIDQQFDFSASSTMPTITDGTVQWNNSNGMQRYGFTASSQWQNNTNTSVRCEYFAEEVSGSAPNIAYLWCLSVGASSYSHACGDGHTITRRWAWKSYANSGAYTPQLTVFSAVSNSTCNGSVDFIGTNVASHEGIDVQVAFQPDRITIASSETIGTIELFDARGSLVASGISNDLRMTIPMDLRDGIYTVRCSSPQGIRTVTRGAVIQ